MNIMEKYAGLIYSRQSKEPVKDQLEFFAREHGCDIDINSILMKAEPSEPDIWGGFKYSLDDIERLLYYTIIPFKTFLSDGKIRI